VTMTMPTTTEFFGYVLEPVREGANITLYHGRRHGNPSPLVAVGFATEQSSPHEYSIAPEFNPGRGAKLLALSRHEGTILVVRDPRGKRLDGVLERDQAQNRIAGGLR
jgi:hypothetical protein